MKRIEARWIALLIVTAGALYLNWLMLLPFIDVLAWAAVLVIVFYPVHKYIVHRTNKPSLAAALSCLLVIVTILLPLTLATLAVVNEASQLTQKIQAGGINLLDPNAPVTGPALRWISQYVDVNKYASQEFIAERLQGVSGAIAQSTIGFVGGIVGAIVQIFFIIFTMFYLFRDGETIRGSLHNLMPLERSQAHDIFVRTRDVISASVYGVLVIATIQGTLGGLAFWALGIPSALVWGVVMILMSLVPLLGSFVVWVPAAIYLAVTGAYVKAAILTFVGAVVIGSIDNFLRPRLVGEKTRLHELLIFFSVLGGLQVFGVLGLVLGPVIVAITLALLDVFRQAERPPQATIPEKSIIERQAEIRNVPEEQGGVVKGAPASS